ncbi:MAG: CDP-diacylglycerol--serine O-phosphatidyltransferase [Planctomycetes bacterium]|nr:CDP-diacylglycerol--serine O-phosphatidyltransferase [Planctomycetota bacterium]
MSNSRYRHRRKQFLTRVRKRPVKTITILPSLVTTLNGVCGFGAIVFAAGGSPIGQFSNHMVIACYLIFVGMIADMMDGHLARLSQSTSSFGGQLDSLCDMISFGVAPAFIMLSLITGLLADSNLASQPVIIRGLWLCALVYVCCAAIRLARFNVENEKTHSEDHSTFTGLPSPAAAGLVCSLILVYEMYEKTGPTAIIPIVLPLITMGAGVLMVTRIKYPHIPNHYLKGKKPISYLIKLLLPIWALIVYTEISLALFACIFALSGLFRAAFLKLKRKPAPAAKQNTPIPPAPSAEPPEKS